MNKYKFLYGYDASMTVTVRAGSYDSARQIACETLDMRYDKAGMEPPVAWTLEMIEFTHASKIKKLKTGDMK